MKGMKEGGHHYTAHLGKAGDSATHKKAEISDQFQGSVRTRERYPAAYEKNGFKARICKGHEGGGVRIPKNIVDEEIHP